MRLGRSVDPAFAWRFAALAGAAAGLAMSPLLSVAQRDGAVVALAVAAAASVGLLAVRPSAPARGLAWLGLVAASALLAGLGVGALRLAAIDGRAFDGAPGRQATVRGFVAATPSSSSGGIVRVQVDAADGKLLVEAHE